MGCPNWDFFFASWQVEHPTGCSQVLGMPHSTVFYSPQTHRGGRVHQVFQLPKTVKDMEVVSHTFAGPVCLRVFLKAAGAIDCCHIYIKPQRAIILQAACDHQGFIDAYLTSLRSVYESRLFRHSPLCRQSVYPPQGHFILADGVYPWLQCPLLLITPYKRQVQAVGAQCFHSQYSRAHSVMKTRFWAIFLQVLEVITAYASSASMPVTSWPRRMSLRNMQEWLRGRLVRKQSGVLSVRANSLLSWRKYTRTRLLLTGKLKILSLGSCYVFFFVSALLTCFFCWRVTSIHNFFFSSFWIHLSGSHRWTMEGSIQSTLYRPPNQNLFIIY